MVGLEGLEPSTCRLWNSGIVSPELCVIFCKNILHSFTLKTYNVYVNVYTLKNKDILIFCTILINLSINFKAQILHLFANR